MNTLEIDKISFERDWGNVLDTVFFNAQSSDLIKIVGSNGSGKTTLLKIMCMLLPLQDGVIRWNGKNIDDEKEDYLDALIYIAHQNAISSVLSPLENLQARAILRSPPPLPYSPIHYEKILSDCGLKKVLSTPCEQLSAGQKRRVALATLRLFNTDIWLLDEPFAALDQEGKDLLCQWAHEHIAAGGIIIASMHDETDLPLPATQSVYCNPICSQ